MFVWWGVGGGDGGLWSLRVHLVIEFGYGLCLGQAVQNTKNAYFNVSYIFNECTTHFMIEGVFMFQQRQIQMLAIHVYVSF